jgi:CheY-like chemotaxis protein
MMRRPFLAGLLVAACFGMTASAFAADTAVTVVKVLNFSCPICRASELQDAQIEAAATATGGRFAYAPLPSEAGEYAREKVYYAARKYGRSTENQVRAAIYRGAQDVNMPFMDVAQVIEWLKDQLPNSNIDWASLAADARSQDTAYALRKAAMLTSSAGAQLLPAYILVQNNSPVATLDLNTSGRGTSLPLLKEDVIARIGQLAAQKSK